jgi:PIN domain nuclease of toxin-antitoxin system
LTLLDTHVWLWYVSDPSKLSEAALNQLASAPLCVSCISVWEIGMLVNQGRLRLNQCARNWVAQCERSRAFTFLPIDNAVALVSVGLPPIHKDPADRLIVATAMVHQIPLVSKDGTIKRYPNLQVIW